MWNLICKHGVKVRLWCAKSRLVPVNEDNIPHLELLGCVLLSTLKLLSKVGKCT